MYPHLRRLLPLLGLLLPAAAIHADDRVASLDDWPAWTREAMTTEARRLKFRRVETPDDSVRTRLPGKTEAPQAMDDGWYFISDIKAESPLECYLFTSSRDLATLIDVIAEASIEAIAGGHDNAGNRRVFHIGAGEVAGLPYLSLEWIYTVQQDGQTMVGFTKVRAAAKGDRAFACNHNYLGYRETFARAFAEFVTSTDMDDMTTQPFYEEIARLDMNGFGTGVVYASYSTDDEGDIHMYASEASLMPVDAATISTSDSYTVTYSTADGEMINAHEIGVENGEITSNLMLQRNAAGTWVSSGSLQGDGLIGIQGPIGHLRPRRPRSLQRLWPDRFRTRFNVARNLFAGDATSASLLVWTPVIDPTRLLEATMTRDDAEVERQAILTMGPVSYRGRFDASGNLENADMTIGPMTLNIERIWSRGSLLE